MKTVLLFRTSFSPQNRFEYKAMFDFAGQHDWQIRTVVYLAGGKSITLLFGNPATEPSSFARLGLTLFAILIVNDICETAQNIYGSALLGVGDTRFALRCSLAAHLLVWTPLLVFILTFHPSIVCCYLSSVIGRGIHALLLYLRWRSGKWRQIHLT